MKNVGLLGCVVVLVVLALIIGGYYVSLRNRVVALDQEVQQAWSEVETQYQRRYELIPNLVATVQGAANFEKSTLEAITRARASVGRPQFGKAPDDPAALAQFDQSQAALSGALSRLLVVAEAYPTLQSNKNFLNLQDQLEGTENRIQVARKRYNDAAKEYNTAILKFPANVLLSGHKPKPYFSVTTPEATQAPKVQFDFNNTTTTATATSGTR